MPPLSDGILQDPWTGLGADSLAAFVASLTVEQRQRLAAPLSGQRDECDEA
jgi:hypothetical protein